MIRNIFDYLTLFLRGMIFSILYFIYIIRMYMFYLFYVRMIVMNHCIMLINCVYYFVYQRREKK